MLKDELKTIVEGAIKASQPHADIILVDPKEVNFAVDEILREVRLALPKKKIYSENMEEHLRHLHRGYNQAISDMEDKLRSE